MFCVHDPRRAIHAVRQVILCNPAASFRPVSTLCSHVTNVMSLSQVNLQVLLSGILPGAPSLTLEARIQSCPPRLAPRPRVTERCHGCIVDPVLLNSQWCNAS